MTSGIDTSGKITRNPDTETAIFAGAVVCISSMRACWSEDTADVLWFAGFSASEGT